MSEAVRDLEPEPDDWPGRKMGQQMREARREPLQRYRRRGNRKPSGFERESSNAAAVHADRAGAWAGAGQSALWDVKVAAVFDPSWNGLGAYPRGFLPWAYAILGASNPAEVLHLCSGGVRGGLTVDIRPSMKPAVVADVRRLPFADNTFEFALADPPYSPEWNKLLYGLPKSKYPPPSAIVREAGRVLRPGGRLGILHYVVPQHEAATFRLVGVWGLTMSMGQRIRAFTVYEKHAQLAMFE